MTDTQVYTLDEVRAMVAERERELAKLPDPYGPTAGEIARDEVLERVCQAMAYMERSLVEVKEARDAELNTLRAELDSLRGARREVARQMEAGDGAQGSAPEAPGAR